MSSTREAVRRAVQKAIEAAAMEGHTEGRVYTKTGEEATPAEEYDRVTERVRNMTAVRDAIALLDTLPEAGEREPDGWAVIAMEFTDEGDLPVGPMTNADGLMVIYHDRKRAEVEWDGCPIVPVYINGTPPGSEALADAVFRTCHYLQTACWADPHAQTLFGELVDATNLPSSTATEPAAQEDVQGSDRGESAEGGLSGGNVAPCGGSGMLGGGDPGQARVASPDVCECGTLWRSDRTYCPACGKVVERGLPTIEQEEPTEEKNDVP